MWSKLTHTYWRGRGLVRMGAKTISPANRRTAVLPARGAEATAAIESNIGVLPQEKGPNGRSARPLESPNSREETSSDARLLLRSQAIRQPSSASGLWFMYCGGSSPSAPAQLPAELESLSRPGSVGYGLYHGTARLSDSLPI